MNKSALELVWFGNSPNLSENALENLKSILALLRAQYMNYQTSHWTAKGDPYYGDHLLFQRLYEAIAGEVDTMAEKLVGYSDNSSVAVLDQVSRVAEILQDWSRIECPFARGLLSEQQLQELLEHTHQGMEEAGELPLSFDDYLPALASAHDTNVYLLQQRLKGHQVKKKH